MILEIISEIFTLPRTSPVEKIASNVDINQGLAVETSLTYNGSTI
jgi:hypothetical protein